MRRPLESAQYTSIDSTQTLADHGVLASVGSVGDAYDNALAESFIDSFKTELIADRVWRTRAQLELAVVGYIGWFNDARLHQALGDRPPSEFERMSQSSSLEISLSEQRNQSIRSPWDPVRLTGPERIDHNRACLSVAPKLCWRANHILRALGDEAHRKSPRLSVATTT